MTKQEKRKLSQCQLVETVRLDYDAIRHVCIDNNYFTRGDNDAYCMALEWFSDEPYSLQSLYELAQYICGYSDLTDYASAEEFVTSCACALSNAATRTYRLREQDDENWR